MPGLANPVVLRRTEMPTYIKEIRREDGTLFTNLVAIIPRCGALGTPRKRRSNRHEVGGEAKVYAKSSAE